MPDVFISYVEEDGRIADQIAQGLQAAGYSTWLYERDGLPGADYLETIGAVIDEARAVVLVISAKSVQSAQVYRELVRAAESDKALFPLLYGIKHEQFQERSPKWRQALGAITSIGIPAEGVAAIMPRLLAGLEKRGVQPSGKGGAPPSAAPLPLPRRAVPVGVSVGLVVFAIAAVVAIALAVTRHGAAPSASPTAQPVEAARTSTAATQAAQSLATPAAPVAAAPATISPAPIATSTQVVPAPTTPGPSPSPLPNTPGLPPATRAAATPLPAPTAVAWASLPAIGPDNASQLQELHRFGQGHVEQVAFSPDGGTLAVATSLGVWLYDQASLAEGRLMEFPSSMAVSDLSFSPDGRTLLAATFDKKLWFWDLETMTLRGTWQTAEAVRAVAFSPDGKYLVTGGDDQLVGLWDLETGANLKTLAGHTKAINALAVSPDGRTIASASTQDSVILWDLETGSLLNRLAVPVWSLAFRNPDGVLVAGCSGSLFVVDPRSGELLSSVEIGGLEADALAFNKEGTLLASAGQGQVHLRDAQTWQPIGILDTESRMSADSLAFGGAQGNLIAFHSYGAPIVEVWDAANRQRLATITGFLVHAPVVHPMPDGRILAADAYDTVYVWDVLSGRVISAFESNNYNPDIVFTADGSAMATASGGTGDTKVRLWDTFLGTERYALDGTEYVGIMAFSPDGRLFAESGINPGNGAKLWNAVSGALLKELAGAEGGTPSLAFDPEGQVLATGLGDGVVRFSRVGQCLESPSDCGALIAESRKHFSSVNAIAFSPDGQSLASGSEDQQVILWKVQDGTPLAMLAGHSGAVTNVRFFPDGAKLASVTREGELIVWDVASQKPLYRLVGGAYGSTFAFSPDGRLLAWTASDDSITLWDVAAGAQLRVCQGHTEWVSGLVFSPDGKLLVSTSADRTVRIWGIP